MCVCVCVCVCRYAELDRQVREKTLCLQTAKEVGLQLQSVYMMQCDIISDAM